MKSPYLSNSLEKFCPSCQTVRSASLFAKNKSRHDGLQDKCKSCRREYDIKRKADMKLNRPDKYEELLIKDRGHCRVWRIKNPEKAAAFTKTWSMNNPENKRKASVKWNKKERQTNPTFRLQCNLRTRFRYALNGRKKIDSVLNALGCSVFEFRPHIESLWSDGMNWQNYGNRRGQWNIDHIIPISYFDLTNEQHFLLGNHYLNMQPMWHVDNARKGNRKRYNQ